MAQSNIPEPLAYTVAHAMAVIGIGRTKLYQLLDTGALKSVNIGRRRLVTAQSIRDLIAPKAA
jgi:excisionase family DNA binding protein